MDMVTDTVTPLNKASHYSCLPSVKRACSITLFIDMNLIYNFGNILLYDKDLSSGFYNFNDFFTSWTTQSLRRQGTREFDSSVDPCF